MRTTASGRTSRTASGSSNRSRSGKIHVTEFYISKMTGALCITVSAPIVDEKDEMVGIFGVDIKFEDWVKRAEDIAEATQIALRGEYEAKSKSDRWL